MDTVNEANMAKIEAEMEKRGVEFKLDVSKMSDALYSELFSEMLEHIGQFTDAPIAYLGNWDITIKVNDVEFEK